MPRRHVLVTYTALALLTQLAAGADFCSASETNLLARYQQLRTVTLDPERSAVTENVVLKKDAAILEFKSGNLYFFAPVGDEVAGAVFVGEGTLRLDPPNVIEQAQLKRFTGEKTSIQERFKEAVLTFTDGTWAELSKLVKIQPGAVPPKAVSALEDFRDSFRNHLKTNQEARILAGLCSHERGQFLALIRGEEFGRMLFSVDALMNEEVQLIRYNNALEYFDTLTSFHAAGSPPIEQRLLVDTTLTTLDTSIDKGGELSADATVEFTPLRDGLRVLYVPLAAPLRVSKASMNGAECKVIQEDKKKDADLWLILPEPLKKGVAAKLQLSYAGKDVVQNEGDGNFYVGSRTRWYPRIDNPTDLFADRSMYRMKFRTPKQFTVVATGQLKSQKEEGKQSITEWETEIPYTVAGFNYGQYKSKKAVTGQTELKVFANEGLGSELKELEIALQHNPEAARSLGISATTFTTTSLIDRSLAELNAALQLYTHYYGALPYKSISMTQQPAGNFGQSWPTLVFMPYTAFLDGTVKHQLGLTRSQGARRFLEQVGAHEVAHQWWGHMVGWKDYHDQWLSEGFAEYSAGIYTHRVFGPQKFQDYIKGVREEIFAPLTGSSTRTNDAGPIWLGHRLSSDKTKGGYQLVYAKGAYVLHMLRMLLYDFSRNDDSRFVALMREFVQTYQHKDASTEDFKRVCDKHFQQDMSWFFQQWVYGTGIPKVKVNYTIAEDGGQVALKGNIKVEGVPADFRVYFPFLLKFKNGAALSGRVGGQGQATFKLNLPEKPVSVEINPFQGLLCELEVKAL